jgi:chitinase
MKIFLLVSSILVATVAQLASSELRVICYWPNWDISRNDDYKHTPEDIDPTLCTHIHYAFMVLDEKNLKPVDSNGSPQVDLYNRINALKQKNPNMKHVMSIGGWGDKSSKYSHAVENLEKRKVFRQHLIEYMQKYKFDGLDIDWEYPVCWQGNCTAGPPSDKNNLAEFAHVSCRKLN